MYFKFELKRGNGRSCALATVYPIVAVYAFNSQPVGGINHAGVRPRNSGTSMPHSSSVNFPRIFSASLQSSTMKTPS